MPGKRKKLCSTGIYKLQAVTRIAPKTSDYNQIIPILRK